MPEPIVYAVVMVMAFQLSLSRHGLIPAIMVLLAHHCYLRPNELFGLTWQFVAPGFSRHAARAVLTLHPREGSRALKTGEFDETVVVDLDWLASILV